MTAILDRIREWLQPNPEEPTEEESVEVREAPPPDYPQSFEEFIGQEEAILELKTEVKAAKREGRRLAHFLLTGPPGIGKTAMAYVLAAEMGGLPIYACSGTDFHTPEETILAIAGVGKLCLTTGNGATIFLIDEIDGVPNRKVLYPIFGLMTHGAVKYRGETYGGGESVTVIGTTNHIASVNAALVSRFGEPLEFDYYPPEELAEIARQSAKKMGFTLTEAAARVIGENGGGEPRKVKTRILRNVANLLEGQQEADEDLVKRAIQLSGLRPLGLSRHQVKYLVYLYNRKNRKAGKQSIAARLHTTGRNIEYFVEPFLTSQEFVVVEDRRVLTEKGVEYVESYVLEQKPS